MVVQCQLREVLVHEAWSGSCRCENRCFAPRQDCPRTAKPLI
ncbi:hypothetical protein ANDA3_2883 [plant metagenome]|uniref:Uncharacterized protein n=1 Tax=plant metagenome TaxID=1297885 RepID=A0A484PNP1_9ZZZZ